MAKRRHWLVVTTSNKANQIFSNSNNHSHATCTVKTWSFPLRISSVNKIKSEVSGEFGYIYYRNL